MLHCKPCGRMLTPASIVFAHNKGTTELEKISMKEKYSMGGDLNKAPKMAEAMIEDLSALQIAMGCPASSSKTDTEAEPVPEVVALQKHIANTKSAYMICILEKTKMNALPS